MSPMNKRKNSSKNPKFNMGMKNKNKRLERLLWLKNKYVKKYVS
jgi:hypothetical protein